MCHVVISPHLDCVAPDHQPGERTIRRARKCHSWRASGNRHGRSDNTTMYKSRNALVRVRCSDAKKTVPHTPAELSGGLGPGNFAPFMIGFGTYKGRVSFGGADSVFTTIPVAQMHLTQIGFDNRLQPKMCLSLPN